MPIKEKVPHTLLKAIESRLTSIGLELHPEKTKIVYCLDGRRRKKYPIIKFDFLGYSFQPRTTKAKASKRLFLGFDCAISISSRKRIADKLEALKFESLSFKSIVGIAKYLNPIIRGWVNYYGKFRMSELSKVFKLLSVRLVRWARKRYKRYRTNLNKAYDWLKRIRIQLPNLFYHWRISKIHITA